MNKLRLGLTVFSNTLLLRSDYSDDNGSVMEDPVMGDPVYQAIERLEVPGEKGRIQGNGDLEYRQELPQKPVGKTGTHPVAIGPNHLKSLSLHSSF